MKNHLLKIASLIILSCGLMLTACSESDNNNDNEEEVTEEVSQEIPEEEIPEEETLEKETPEEIVLTDICMFCPAYSIEQSSASNPVAVTISEPDGTICKGEDGKAYIDGVLNENNLSYEDYLQVRQMILRCSDL